MPDISFALIDSKLLKLKALKVKQIETVIEVSGQLDPLQLQKIRDRVAPGFVARKEQIAGYIEDAAKQLERETDARKRDAIAKACVASLDKSSKAFDKKAQKAVADFCAADTAMMASGSGNWQFAVSTAWSATSIVVGLVEAGRAAMSGNVAELPGILKALLDAALEIESTAESVGTWWRSLEQQQKELEGKLAVLKAVKKGAPVPQSAIDKAEVAQAGFGPKINALEKETRSLSVMLDKLLKQAKGIPDDAIQAEAEKAIGAMIDSIITLSANLAEKRDAQKRAADTIRTARTKAQKDTWYWVEWAKTIYGFYNDVSDVTNVSTKLMEAAKAFVATVKQSKAALEKLRG